MQPSSSWISTLPEAGMDYSLLRRQLWILVPISGSGKLRPFNSRISMLPKRWHAVLGKIFSPLLRLLLRIQRGRCFDKGSSMKTNLRPILWRDDLLPRTLLCAAILEDGRVGISKPQQVGEETLGCVCKLNSKRACLFSSSVVCPTSAK